MITEFELSEQFQPFYKSGKAICVTADGFIVADDGKNINYINRQNFQNIGHFNEKDEEVTCFVANPYDYTVIIANKNLLLRKIDRFNEKARHKTWNSNHSAPIFAMCLNKSSTRLTTGGGDNKVRIWHLGAGEGNSYSCIYHKSKINIVKNHPNENFVVSSSLLDYEVVAWNTETGKQMGVFTGHQNVVTDIDFHTSSTQMITSSRDEAVIIWDWKTFEKLTLIPTLESVETCIVVEQFMNQPSTDDYLIMVGGVNGIMKTLSPHKKSIIQEFRKASLFDNQNNQDSKTDKSGLKMIRSIMRVDNSIIVVRESDNIEFYTKEMSLEYELAGDLSEIRDIIMVGQNKDILLVVELAPYMRLFSCRSFFDDNQPKPEQSSKSTQWACQLISGGHTKDITSVSAFNDGLMVASGGKDGKVCIWQLVNDKKVQMKLITSLKNDNNIVQFLCVDSSGERIYVNYSFDDTLAVLSFRNNKLARLFSVSKPHSNTISSMDININSSLLATGSKDKCAKLWSFNSKTNEIVSEGTLKGHKRGIWSVKFSTLEKILLTSSMDQTIKLWSIEDFSCVSTFQSEFPIYRALFYNNEKQIISCDENGMVTVWNRDKRSVIKNFKVHDTTIDCLTLLSSNNGQTVRGFAAAGGSSMICLYRDNSEIHQSIVKEQHELEIQHQQELDNLLFNHQYSRALRLAIKLDKPLAAYRILSKIQESETELVEELTPVKMSHETELGTAVNGLERDELQKLFLFSIKWITNAKTFIIGERVVAVILCSIPNSELLMWPDFATNIEALHAYSTRYYRRIKEDSDRMTFFAYLRDILHTVPFIDLTMDTS